MKYRTKLNTKFQHDELRRDLWIIEVRVFGIFWKTFKIVDVNPFVGNFNKEDVLLIEKEAKKLVSFLNRNYNGNWFPKVTMKWFELDSLCRELKINYVY